MTRSIHLSGREPNYSERKVPSFATISANDEYLRAVEALSRYFRRGGRG